MRGALPAFVARLVTAAMVAAVLYLLVLVSTEINKTAEQATSDRQDSVASKPPKR